MKELLKLLIDKITELTGLPSGYPTDELPITPHFRLIHKGLKPIVYLPGKQKLQQARIDFNLEYRGQLNNTGNLETYIENEINLLKLFTKTVANKTLYTKKIELGSTTNYEDCNMILEWNDNSTTTNDDPFSETEFQFTKRVFNLELYFKPKI